MLSAVNQTINLTAGVVIDEKVVVLMSASIRSGEDPAISKIYKDVELYKENRDKVDAEIKEFEDKVLATHSMA